MKKLFKFTFIGLLFVLQIRCFKTSSNFFDTPDIKNIPPTYVQEFSSNGYSISDLWPLEQDSTLLNLLDDFNKSNNNMLLLDIKNMISATMYKINSKESLPDLNISNSIAQSKQNLSAFGLNDDFLNSENQEQNTNENNSDQSGFKTLSNSVRLNSSWELDLWGKVRNSKNASWYKLESDIFDTEYAKASLRGNFIKLYFSMISFSNDIKIYEKNLKNLSRIKEISEQRTIEGISGYDESYLASSNFFLFEAVLIRMKHELTDLKSQIKIMLGHYLDSNEYSIHDSFTVEVSDFEKEITSDLLKRRPDIKSSYNNLINKRFELKVANKMLFPSITFNTSVGYSSSSVSELINEQYSVWSIGLNVLSPIFNKGKIRNNIKISDFNLQASEIEYIDKVINAIYEVDSKILESNSLRKSYKNINKAEENAQKAFDFAIESYELGLVDLIYVLTIQERLNNILLEKNKILLEQYINRIDLILALGGKFEY